MHYPYFDIKSLILYLCVGSLCVFAIHISKGSIRINKKRNFEGLFLIFIILLLFAGLRKVGFHLGGEDALRYEYGFINFYNHGADRFNDTDILFGYFTGIIRTFTENPYIYRFICYGLIAFGYVFFINKICPQGVSCIPFICIMIPYMRSINTMRNSMSIAIFLMSLIAFYDKKKLLCILLICASILMHRLSIIMVSIFPFILIFSHLIKKMKLGQFICFTIIMILLSYLLARQLQKLIVIFSLFANNGNSDMWYLTRGAGKNILLNWPMYIVHCLLLIALTISWKSLPNSRQVNFLKILFIFDIILLPASLVLGMWRFVEYLYIPNLILWSIVINCICQKFTKSSKIILKSCLVLGFYGLLIMRLMREWQEASIMPHLFLWS